MTNTIFYTRRLLILGICLLFIMFLSTDVYDVEFYLSSNVMKFMSIFLCLLISIISSPLKRQSRNVFLLQLGLIFTTMADYIFLIHGDDLSIAIGLFSIVQIIYSLRYREGNEEIRILRYVIIYLVILITYKTFERFYEIDELIAISIFYSICLISSVRDALWLYKNNMQQYKNRVILLGMMLFLLCDINLGLNYILGEKIFSISIWTYYLPSQILLALSGSGFWD
ncbi:MAG: lysoplasmalogenase family protein [Tissierellaceae bacterium]|nr:lysoplasmalogenase family protein [Tissierellaceae bacterium]